ncbi:MAG: hypothetical protein QM708_13960 [Propioniciclava sp.]|uniref:hypothetical protein n=1 Tax=Propioniciclava sp. TaxID=2038686 RepID=UPI0039E6470F
MTKRAGRAWAIVDRGTRLWWQAWGRRIDDVEWLDRSVAVRGLGGEGWLDELRGSGRVRDDIPGNGILPDLGVLDSAGFRAADLHPLVRDFYEHTSLWDMDVRIVWSRWFAFGGWLIERFFGRRVQQLAIPVTPGRSSRSMSSSVSAVFDDKGRREASAWTRRLVATGECVYSGRYATKPSPIDQTPLVHTTFPLEDGNIQVLLTPSVEDDGSLRLSSPAGGFGEPGAYAVVRNPRRDTWHAARLPLHEEFRVYVDASGALRTVHDLRLWRAGVLRLSYEMRRRRSGSVAMQG